MNYLPPIKILSPEKLTLLWFKNIIFQIMVATCHMLHTCLPFCRIKCHSQPHMDFIIHVTESDLFVFKTQLDNWFKMFITTISSMIYKTVTVNMKQDTLLLYVCVYWG